MSHSPRTGAHDDFTRIYETYSPRIAAYALRRTATSEAADAVAETFLVAWRRYEEIPAEPQTLPWLYGVIRRTLANQHRSRHRRGRLHDRLTQEFARFDHTPDSAEQGERFQLVATALRELSEDDAELLRLTAWEGLTPAQIATVMEIAPAAVRQRLRRARVRLRAQLGHDDVEFEVVDLMAWGSPT